MLSRCSLNLALLLLIICLAAPPTNALIRTMNQKQYKLLDSYMDANANPCTDFFQYACGNWQREHGNESYTDTLEKVDHELNEEYESVIKTRKQNLLREHRFVRQLLTFYKSCTAVSVYLPSKYLRKLESYEGLTWSLLRRTRHNRNFVHTDWLRMLAVLRKYGLNGIFISESVLAKKNNSSEYVIDIDRPLYEEEFIELTRTRFDLVMEAIGMSKRHDIEDVWDEFSAFETKLVEFYDIADTKGYKELSLKDITVPHLKEYLEIVLNVTQLDEQTEIGITNRAYMHAIFRFLNNYDNDFICRYLTIRFLWHLYYDSPSAFDSTSCITNLREEMPLAMAWLYEQQHPELLAETEYIKRMFDGLRARFAEELTANPNNFDDEVLEFLSTKLKHMQLKVGNLPRNATVMQLEAFYRELTLSENDFYGNHLNILRLLTNNQHAQLQKPLPQDADNFYYLEEAGFGSTTTPYYLPRQNMVILPLNLLHLPVYHPQLHDVFKYSLIGFLLGHEITHGFDDTGLDYDYQGNMHETLGELIKSNQIFDRHMECLLGKNPNVIDEKIADVSGLRWAYETYFGTNGTLPAAAAQQLPWSKMTQQQLFFRNFALFFCGDVATEEQLVNSSHGTYRSRLYDTISQFDEFGRAYNCQTGASMNPTRKCQLWR